MKTWFRFAFMFFLVVAALYAGTSSIEAVELYVSLAGSDSWSGKLPEPNAAKTDGPFATLERARDAIRELRKNGPFMPEPVTVFIGGGNYSITDTFLLTAQDTGYPHAPIIYRAYPGENVTFIGGKEVTGFGPVTDKKALKRINSKFRKNIVKADLKALGITDFGTVTTSGGKRMELYFKGKFMEIARYPDEGWLKIADVPQDEGKEPVFEGDKPHKRFGIFVGRHYGKITYDGDRPKRWAPADDIWMHGYWTWDWSDGFVRVDKIDTKKREVYIAAPHHGYGYTKEQRYYFLNVLEELDTPGEWYLDAKKGLLYFWPPEPIGKGDVYFPVLDKVMVSIEGTEFVTLLGITFKSSRGGGVSISGGKDNLVAGCTFTNLGKYAVTVNDGMRNGVTGCDIYEVASGGVMVNGGDRKTLTPADNFVTNNHIHHFARRNKTYNYAIGLNGVENRAANNFIHDAPHIAIGWSGNENVIELNEIYDVVLETNDAGAIYNGRNPSMQGNMIRYNYFHDIGGESGLGTCSVYFDDYHCGNFVLGNVFYKGVVPGTSKFGAVFIHVGRYNVIDNNIFVECQQAYGSSQWNQEAMDRWIPMHNWKRLLYEDVDITKPPYSDRYPWIQNILEDKRLNTVTRNLAYKCGSFIGRGEVVEQDNLVTNDDPGFVDAAKGNYALKDDSWVYSKIPGFKKIPFDKIGLYVDEYRTSLPKKGQ